MDHPVMGSSFASVASRREATTVRFSLTVIGEVVVITGGLLGSLMVTVAVEGLPRNT